MARQVRGGHRDAKLERQRLVRELVSAQRVSNQQQLVQLLADRGVAVTQATASRDIAELGLVKVASHGSHIYATPEEVGLAIIGDDARLRRVLADYPVRVGRSGLTLLLISEAGTAGAIAQAVDESTLQEQEGTLAGDNTVLVLFADEDRLETWLARFRALQPLEPTPRPQPGDGRPETGNGR
jgi:transcriptional regulator of arginine metabolism